jgi:hypothetical protein
MLSAPLALLTLALGAPAACPATPAEAPLPHAGRSVTAVTDSTAAALFASGLPYDTFVATARERRALWVTLTEEATVPADAIAQVRGLTAPLRVLIVAIDGCSDSANTLPYIARLLGHAPSVQLRVVLPDAGAPVMAAYRTPDGRAATPTLVVLDARDRVVGCWVERPAALQQLALEARAAGTLDAYQRSKQDWYDADAGVSTAREVAAVLRGAATGTPICSATAGR